MIALRYIGYFAGCLVACLTARKLSSRSTFT
jgi:hypothetical protein